MFLKERGGFTPKVGVDVVIPNLKGEILILHCSYPHFRILNSTRRSRASLASSRPVPMRFSLAPTPVATNLSESRGSLVSSWRLIASALKTESLSLSCAGPVGEVWPTISRHMFD